MDAIIEVVPEMNGAKQRRAPTYSDYPDQARKVIMRVWDIEYIPLPELRAAKESEVTRTRSERLSAIDASTIRPLRAVLSGTADQADRDKLDDLEAAACAVRAHADKLLSALKAASTADEVLEVVLTGWP